MGRKSQDFLWILAFASVLSSGGAISQETNSVTPIVHMIRPSVADARVKAFDDPNVAITGDRLPANAPLAVFFPGTGGKPSNAIQLYSVVLGQGYRVLGLEYNDFPSVMAICPQNPDPKCAAEFREMRISGKGKQSPIINSPAEGIVARLVAALTALAKAHPSEGWQSYLNGDEPRWDRIVLSGLSQGAGMAAFLAKQHAVRRVVLFSSPWDYIGREKQPAPWLSQPSETPVERWYAEYNLREKTANLIQASYRRLGIPQQHVEQFANDLPQNYTGSSPNPYHVATIKDVRYADKWRYMFGNGAN